ncbi:MAG: CCA tRNA nucleotidyltransferase [Sneathiella sp.]
MSEPVPLFDLKKTPPRWMSCPESQLLFASLRKAGGEGRFVGGCVRDALLGEISDDIDVCTNLTPEAVMSGLSSSNIRVIPTGLKHGTVTAIVGDYKYEITTLRVDVETDGRHATVSFTENWREDAARRDFTINALYLTEQGELNDYFGGQQDLQSGIVRFIGDADARIEEDRLRVLRYFRFFARFGEGLPDDKAVKACTKAASHLGQLSKERITQEFMRLLETERSPEVLLLMAKTDVLGSILPGEISPDRYKNLMVLSVGSDVTQRLSVLFQGNKDWAKNISSYLRLSGRTEKRLQAMCAEDLPLTLSLEEQRASLYQLGVETFTDRLLLAWSKGAKDEICLQYLDLAKSWEIPTFPVSGRDLINKGHHPGKMLGELLAKLDAIWIESDFQMTKSDLLARL